MTTRFQAITQASLVAFALGLRAAEMEAAALDAFAEMRNEAVICLPT